jgi:hypothetical protein
MLLRKTKNDTFSVSMMYQPFKLLRFQNRSVPILVRDEGVA